MSHFTLPPIFDAIVADPRNELLGRAAADGRQAIGVTCSFVPEPLLAVDGLVPIRVRANGVVGTPLADTYLSSVVCPYVRSLLESVLDGLQGHLAGWVLAASCDHLRRLADNMEYLRRADFLHVLDVPHKSDDLAVDFFTNELQGLAEQLKQHFGVDTGPEALRSAIAKHNEHLTLVRTLAALRWRDRPALTGAAFHRVMVACATAPKDLLRRPLERLCEQLADEPGVAPPRARLLLVASQVDDPDYLRLIESQGAVIVADRFCLGSLPLGEPIPTTAEPFRALAEHYLRTTSCPRMMDDVAERAADVIGWAERSGADGIVISTMKFCDLWGVEASLLSEVLRDAGWPVLRLEREYALSGEGQVRTRVQAFIESMGK